MDIEIVLLVWMCAETSANLQDVLAEGLHVWAQYYWNWVDIVALSLYWIGFWLRLHAPEGGYRTVQGAKLAFAFGVAAVYLRTFRFCKASGADAVPPAATPISTTHRVGEMGLCAVSAACGVLALCPWADLPYPALPYPTVPPFCRPPTRARVCSQMVARLSSARSSSCLPGWART